MVDQSRADLMMKFVDKDRQVVWAESTLNASPGDSFMDGFEPTSSADEYSAFFEVKSFNFAIAVKPQDKGVGALSKQAAASAGGGRPSAASDEFLRWRSAKEDEYRKIHFPVEFNAFSFTRLLDAASMPFFTACCNSVSFYSASLVKRVSVGTAGSDKMMPMGFLRFDFRDVLITGVNWDDGDLVSESCTFICRAMRVKYKQQQADGSLRPPVGQPAVWPQRDPEDPTAFDPRVLLMVQELMNG